jgi:predicted RNase H-like HicB family nuclease
MGALRNSKVEVTFVAKKKASARQVVKETVYTYTALFEPATEGCYTVTVPKLPGVITEGDTLVKARERVKEAIRGYLKLLQKHREPIPVERKAEVGRPITERVAVSV